MCKKNVSKTKLVVVAVVEMKRIHRDKSYENLKVNYESPIQEREFCEEAEKMMKWDKQERALGTTITNCF